MAKLLDVLQEKVLLCDGAMGTQLQGAGLELGGCGELWNIEHPGRVLNIQKSYAEAGSDCLLTNTFGACRIMLDRHDAAHRVDEINRAAVTIARLAFEGRPGYVIGDIGPFGGLMEPLGDISPDSVQAAFSEQAQSLVAAGADAVIVETQTSLEELEIGLSAAREAGAGCVIGSIAFGVTADGSDARTMMGVGPEQGAAFLQENGADVAAPNCGAGIDVGWAARIVRRYRAACDLPTMAQPNAGTPTLENLQIVYKVGAQEMAAEIPDLLESRVRIIGGCCGSTPRHIRCFRSIVDEWNGGRHWT